MASQGMELTGTACGVRQDQLGLVAGSMSAQQRGRVATSWDVVSTEHIKKMAEVWADVCMSGGLRGTRVCPPCSGKRE